MQLSKNGTVFGQRSVLKPRRLNPAKSVKNFKFEISNLRFVSQVVGVTGLEPVTPRLSSACSNQLSYTPVSNAELRMMNAERLKPVLHSSFSILHSKVGGAEEIRTPDL